MPSFSRDFEKDILAALRRNPDKYKDYREILEPEIFSHPVYRKIAIIWEDFFLEHGELPTTNTMVELIAEYDEQGWWVDKDLEFLTENIDPIMNGYPVNEDFVLDKIIAFAKRRKLEQKLSEAAEKVSRDEADVGDLIDIIKDAEVKEVQKKKEKDDDFIKHMVDHVLALREKGDDVYQPFYIPPLDSVLGGGPKRGNKIIIMGPPGGGKTTIMTNVVGNTVLNGGKALYLFNDDTEEEMDDRFTAFFSDVPTSKLTKDESLEAIEKTQKTLERGRGRIYRRFIERGTGAAEVRNIVESRMETDSLDVLVIDHVRNLESKRVTDNIWRDLGEVFMDLYAIAIEHDLVLYVVAHTKAEAEGKRSFKQKYLGLSYEPTKDANIIMAVWRLDDDEKETNGSYDAFRTHVVKRRGGPGLGAQLRFKADFETSKIDLIEKGEDMDNVINDDEDIGALKP